MDYPSSSGLSPLRSRRDLLAGGAGLATALAALTGLGWSHSATAAPTNTCCPIVELRQYTLHAGARGPFTGLFEREFIESQEALGMRVIGQFWDLDDPNRFVWVRGFPDMPSRAASLGAFYGGPVWKEYGREANAAMIDSDNVLLLRPARSGSGFPSARLGRPGPGAAVDEAGVVVASIHYVDADMIERFGDFFQTAIKSRLQDLGVPVFAEFTTETGENTFKGLPVRERDHVFVWFSSFASRTDCDMRLLRVRASQSWREDAPDPILHQLVRKPELLRLSAQSRSALRA
jgi:hypothetical protein